MKRRTCPRSKKSLKELRWREQAGRGLTDRRSAARRPRTTMPHPAGGRRSEHPTGRPPAGCPRRPTGGRRVSCSALLGCGPPSHPAPAADAREPEREICPPASAWPLEARAPPVAREAGAPPRRAPGPRRWRCGGRVEHPTPESPQAPSPAGPGASRPRQNQVSRRAEARASRFHGAACPPQPECPDARSECAGTNSTTREKSRRPSGAPTRIKTGSGEAENLPEKQEISEGAEVEGASGTRPNGPGAQLRAAREPRWYSGGRPQLPPPNRPTAGWEPGQAPKWRRVSCCALLGSRALLRPPNAN